MEWKMELIARNGGGTWDPLLEGWVWGIQTVHLHILHLIISISWYWHLQLWRGSFSARVLQVFFLIKKMSFDWSCQLLTLYSFYSCLLLKSLFSLPSSEVFSILSKLPISIKLYPTLLFPRSKKWTNLHVIADQELVSKKWSLNWATIDCEF